MRKPNNIIILQGHRGCTGYYPENSIEGFLHAIAIGVSAIEMDIVVSKDLELIVSHDPFFRSDICYQPNGDKISKKDELSNSIFTKNVAEIQSYTCKNDSVFPDQKKIIHSKPRLLDTIHSIQNYCLINKKKLPQLTIEIKSEKKWESEYQPDINTFVSLIHQFDVKYLSDFNVLYHSFDIRILKGLEEKGYSNLDFLFEKEISQLKDELNKINFKLRGVGVHHQLIDEKMIRFLDNKGLTLSAWTVNEKSEIKRLLLLGVRNIITDFPLMAKEIIEENNFEIQ